MDMKQFIGVLVTLFALVLLYPGIWLLQIGNDLVSEGNKQ